MDSGGFIVGEASIGTELGRNIFPFQSAEQIKSQPEPAYLVQNLLPARGVAAIFGESGSGKSFLAMDLVFAISSGIGHWFGLKAKQRGVLYVALEGQGGLRRRILAWERHYGRELTDRVRFQRGNFLITDANAVESVSEAALSVLGSGCVVVVDTLNQAAPGADENNSSDMGLIIAGAQAIATKIDGLVLLIHHSGKDRSRGLRGHSSLNAAMDAVLEVSRDGDIRCWKATKVKDDDCGAVRYFRLKSYNVGHNDDGEEVRGCAVEIDLTPIAQKPRPLAGKNRIACMDALKRASNGNAVNLTWSQAMEAVAPNMNAALSRQNSRAKETLESLVNTGHLRREGAHVCIAV